MTRSPTEYEDLRRSVEGRYDDLSDRLRRVARHLLDHPSDLAFETLAVVASKSGVQPSSIVRFAQAFGFDGATRMQRVVRAGLLEANPALAGQPTGSGEEPPISVPDGESTDRLTAAVDGGRAALADTGRSLPRRSMAEAVALVSAADTVFVVGSGRALPVATYLLQSLGQARRRAVLVDGNAGPPHERLGTLRPSDLVVVVELTPPGGEARAVIDAAGLAGCPVVVIGSRGPTPTSRRASVVLTVKEPDLGGPPSLVASMTLSQALVAAVMDGDVRP